MQTVISNLSNPFPVILGFFLLFIIRNYWVFKRRMWYSLTTYKIAIGNLNKVSAQLGNPYSIRSVMEWNDNLWSYNKCLLCFWIWDFGKMVYNKNMYQEYLEMYQEYLEEIKSYQ